ncbi:mandelate racemase/muconate lactonizing enzyme family protein [Micrococcus terreus]|uniref:mandelate racemase/muconate lactonizing enzyme family protein n=1 Tax=Micrococcus terreus TaxID=574650 RepID=UPI0034065F37
MICTIAPPLLSHCTDFSITNTARPTPHGTVDRHMRSTSHSLYRLEEHRSATRHSKSTEQRFRHVIGRQKRAMQKEFSAVIIERVETWVLRVPFIRTSADFDGAHHELIGATVHADGVSGLGYSFITDHAGGVAVKALLDELLVPRLIGRDATKAEQIWFEFEALTHRMGTGINRFAMASIDIALWDLRAKVNGRSLAAEIGQIHESVPAYGSGKAGNRLSLSELVELSEGYISEGFTAVKLRVGENLRNDPDRVSAVRRALGDDVGIMIDANERLSYSEALSLGRRLEEFDPLWFEEPMPYMHREAHVRLAQHLAIPVVGGEHHCSAEGFVDYVTSGAFSVLQPNVCMVGGITEMVRIMKLAELHGVGFAPHLMTDLNVHLAATTNSTIYVEYFPWMEPYTENRLTIDEGRALVPEGPGHGIQFTSAAFEQYRVA